MLRADFHIHTKYSMDCEMELDDIIETCRIKNLNCINICDHGTVEGALKLKDKAPFKVIVGEEILTPHGEIMGMFLSETIPSGISVEKAVEQVKQQGGLVCLPHPFDPFRGLSLTGGEIDELAKDVDVVEVFNARSHSDKTAEKAFAYASRHNLPGTAGSDSHTLREIGYTFVELPEFDTKEEFLAALRQVNIHRKKAGMMVHLSSTWTKLKRKL